MGLKAAIRSEPAPPDALVLMELQGSTDLVTKTELLDAVRAHGLSISDRTLTYYMTEQIMPKAVRVGTRGGAYPRVVIELLRWVVRAREMGTPVDAVRELVPLWEFLVRSRRVGEILLSELEYLAREWVVSSEANHAVPWLVKETVGNLCPRCAPNVAWVLKDGTRVAQSDGLFVTFHLAEVDEHNPSIARRIEWTQLTLPGFAPELDAPDAVILGVPNGVRVLCDTDGCSDNSLTEAAPAEAAADRQEVLR
jgi:DNA-binding transcriptional MerR regulator